VQFGTRSVLLWHSTGDVQVNLRQNLILHYIDPHCCIIFFIRVFIRLIDCSSAIATESEDRRTTNQSNLLLSQARCCVTRHALINLRTCCSSSKMFSPCNSPNVTLLHLSTYWAYTHVQQIVTVSLHQAFQQCQSIWTIWTDGEHALPCTLPNESDKSPLHITPTSHSKFYTHKPTNLSIALQFHQVTADLNHSVNTKWS
jgi:hypothetical protein